MTKTTEREIRIMPVGLADVERLRALAIEIWRHHYASIISVAQIEYMLNQRYNTALLESELQRGDLWWDQLVAARDMIAFSSYFLDAATGEMKLDKLYVHPDQQRLGYGAMLVDRATSIARAYGYNTVIVRVNKTNQNAIAAYEKYGFSVRSSLVEDIGGGFVMDDHLMAKNI